MGLDSTSRKKRAEKALAKQAAGKAKLTREELRDIEWLQSQQRDEILLAALAALPKGLYCQLAGRQQKVVDEHARRHQLPLIGDTVDLFRAVKSLHDLLSEHGDRIVEQTNLAKQLVEEEIAHRRAKRRIQELEYEKKADSLVSRVELNQKLAAWSQKLRAFGEFLGREYGRDAQLQLNDLLTAVADEHDPPATIDNPDPQREAPKKRRKKARAAA